MDTMTGGTYFSGGEGVGIAMRAMGIEHKFGVEFDDAIANVARHNGFESITANVCEVDPAALPYVDIFHASPVCKNASNAKANGEESPEDIATAQAVCRYVEHHKPRVFTLENVWGYRKFQAFQNILQSLHENGYAVKYWHLNSADYGVPQTRKRLILIARRDGCKIHKPIATHTENPRPLFETRQKWIGWYEAIEDLIPTLPPSKFAKWQLERLPKEFTDVLIGGGNRSHSFLEFAKENRPNTPGKRFRDDPSHAISATASQDVRAFIVDGKLGSYSTNMTVRDGGERFATVTGSHNNRDLKAFVFPTGNSSGARPYWENEPFFTVTIGHDFDQAKMSVEGRVVKMTPRALARFQSVPDDYILPEKTSLACTIIGNMVPPKLYGAVLGVLRD